jgi:transcriptional activator of cad operon
VTSADQGAGESPGAAGEKLLAEVSAYGNRETSQAEEPNTVVILRRVLLCPAREPGAVLGKERIIEEVWPETFVTDGVLWNAVSELRRVFGDDPHHGEFIATIPKSGYRLVAPVTIAEVSGDVVPEIRRDGRCELSGRDDESKPVPHPVSASQRHGRPEGPPGRSEGAVRPIDRRARAGAGTAAALLVAAFIWFSLPAAEPVEIESIAVLPPENSSRQPELDHLAEGIAGTVADSLAQRPELRVVPASCAFRYRGVSDLDRIARELGARTLLTGTLQVRGDDLSLRVELIDTLDNRLLWGSRFHSKGRDPLAFQDEIAREISRELQLCLIPAEEETERSVLRRAADLSVSPEGNPVPE